VQFTEMTLPTRSKRRAAQSNRGLLQIDDFDARHCAQNLFRGFDDAVDAGMAV
jgi:hypothetical protein